MPIRFQSFSGLIILVAVVQLGCGGGSGGGSAAPVAITVAVTPEYIHLLPGGTQLFKATVSGSADVEVRWSVPGGATSGKIDATGLYTAPALSGVFTVRATLSADASHFGEGTADVGAAPAPGTCASADLGAGVDLHGFLPFPADNPWNQDISGASVDPASEAIISFIGADAGLKGDFGSGLWDGGPIGIPYVVVAGSQATVPITYQAYGNESDPGPMPIPADAPIEGGSSSSGDRHVLVMDRDNCILYELYNAYPNAGGGWDADSGTVWDLHSDALRPWGWTSADAAGLPIFPGLVRYDEVARGSIDHALRFTVPTSRKAYVPPASHWASSDTDASAPPMGMRVRLKAGVDISGYPASVQVILEALKKYGMILADNGSAWYLSGAPDERWNNDDIHLLGGIKGSDLEVVTMDPLYLADPTGSAPSISSLTATPSTVSAGQSATLSWTVHNATRVFLSPEPGLVRGSSVTVHPASTITYTLTVEGPFGVATSTITVNVH